MRGEVRRGASEGEERQLPECLICQAAGATTRAGGIRLCIADTRFDVWPFDHVSPRVSASLPFLAGMGGPRRDDESRALVCRSMLRCLVTIDESQRANLIKDLVSRAVPRRRGLPRPTCCVCCAVQTAAALTVLTEHVWKTMSRSAENAAQVRHPGTVDM